MLQKPFDGYYDCLFYMSAYSAIPYLFLILGWIEVRIRLSSSHTFTSSGIGTTLLDNIVSWRKKIKLYLNFKNRAQ